MSYSIWESECTSYTGRQEKDGMPHNGGKLWLLARTERPLMREGLEFDLKEICLIGRSE
jgi:hypothetical protein